MVVRKLNGLKFYVDLTFQIDYNSLNQVYWIIITSCFPTKENRNHDFIFAGRDIGRLPGANAGFCAF